MFHASSVGEFGPLIFPLLPNVATVIYAPVLTDSGCPPKDSPIGHPSDRLTEVLAAISGHPFVGSLKSWHPCTYSKIPSCSASCS